MSAWNVDKHLLFEIELGGNIEGNTGAWLWNFPVLFRQVWQTVEPTNQRRIWEFIGKLHFQLFHKQQSLHYTGVDKSLLGRKLGDGAVFAGRKEAVGRAALDQAVDVKWNLKIKQKQSLNIYQI